MNYKLLILVIALIFLVILLYREVVILKDNLLKNINDVQIELSQNTNSLAFKLNDNINKCVSHIKNINSENMQQLKKITLLNNQPITRRNTCHFTETDDSDGLKFSSSEENLGDIHYFSDMRINSAENSSNLFDTKYSNGNHCDNQNQINQYSNYYMSEDSDNLVKKSDGSYNSDDSHSINNENNSLDIPIYNQEESNQNDSNATSTDDLDENITEDSKQSNIIANNLNETEIEIIDMINNDPYISNLEEVKNYLINEPINEDNDTSNDGIIEMNEIDEMNEINEINEINETNEKHKIDEVVPENITKLSKESTYTLTDLKNLSKKYKLPITGIINGKRQTYKKKELYANIKKYLKNKI